MKKINLLLLAATTMAIAACSPDNSEGTKDANSTDLVGTWYIGMNPVWPAILDSMYIDQPGTIIFTSDGKFTQESEWDKATGTYTYADGILSIANERVWWYDWELEKLVEQPDSFFSTLPSIYSPKLLYDKSIMIQKAKIENPDPQFVPKEDSFEMFFKVGANGPSDSGLIQGFWNWKAFGNEGTSRLAVKFEGNNFEFWNPSWHERFNGTFEYKNGIVKFIVNSESFKVRRWWDLPDDFDREATANLNELWLTPDPSEDRMEPTFGWVFVMPFVVDGNKAYSSFANLHAVFDKQ